MAVTKVVDYASDRKTKAQAAAANAQAAMADALVKLAASESAHEASLKDVSDLTLEMVDLRRQLQAIVVPGTAQPILDQLAADLTTMRGKREALLDAEEDLFYRQRAIDRAQAQLSRANAVLASATAGKDAADADEADRQKLRDAIKQPPLKTMKATATALVAGAVYSAAQNYLRGGAIPSGLFDRAIRRGDEAAATIDAARLSARWAENVLNEDLNATQGQAGAITAAKTAFQRSQDAYRNYVVTAKARFDLAQALLTAIPSGPLPSAAEAALINDNTKQAARDTALANEAALAQAQAAFDGAQASVDKAIWEAERANPDTEPNTDANVQAAVALRDGAIKTALTQATSDFTTGMQTTLDEWQTDVPESTWGLVSDFQIANAILVDLANTDPKALQTQMDNDEQPYAQALSDQAQNERAMLLLTDAVQDSADKRDAVTRTTVATTSSAVRGSA